MALPTARRQAELETTKMRAWSEAESRDAAAAGAIALFTLQAHMVSRRNRPSALTGGSQSAAMKLTILYREQKRCR